MPLSPKNPSNEPIPFSVVSPNTLRLRRHLFWARTLVAVLLLSNLLLCSLAVWSLRGNDLAYSSIIGKNLPLIEKLNDVTVDFSRVQRRHLNLFLVPSAEGAAVRAECAELISVADASLRKAALLLADANMGSEANDLVYAADAYRENLRKLIGLIDSNQKDEAEEYARSSLRPTLENILRNADHLLSRVHGEALRDSRQLSEDSRIKNAVFLGLAGWPLLFILGAGILFLIVVVILVFLAFRLQR